MNPPEVLGTEAEALAAGSIWQYLAVLIGHFILFVGELGPELLHAAGIPWRQAGTGHFLSCGSWFHHLETEPGPFIGALKRDALVGESWWVQPSETRADWR